MLAINCSNCGKEHLLNLNYTGLLSNAINYMEQMQLDVDCCCDCKEDADFESKDHCRNCGNKLTDDEKYYYTVSCERCETKRYKYMREDWNEQRKRTIKY